MTEAPIIVWFRQDLRVADNPALAAAAEAGAPMIPLYVLDDETAGPWAAGGASRWWLHHSLVALDRALADLGPGPALSPRFVIRKGPAADVVPALAAETGARAVYWNRLYEPFAFARDSGIKTAVGHAGVEVRSFNASLLHEPWQVVNKAGDPLRVFTPFWRACRERPVASLVSAPKRIHAVSPAPSSDGIDALALLPTQPDWAGGLRDAWTPGEVGAQQRLVAFLDEGLNDYAEGRDRPDKPATSRLSPHLHFGEIGPRQIWHAAQQRIAAGAPERDAAKFLSEVGWREFSHHLLFHNPDLPERPLQPRFADFPWADDAAGLCAWQKGQTGYPIVDAGMRELWATGWMHNRVRMIVASFLVKDLLIPWQDGEAWFWDTLVDADLANNAASWQWVAGCGADAAPFFRVFNPVLQGRKFDPDGAYVRQWVPEIANLPGNVVHAPWEASALELSDSGVTLGKTYPAPIVDHAEARQRALRFFETIRQ